MKKSSLNSIIKSFASIKLGIVIILLLAFLTAIGTLVEAHYNDAAAAQKFVYHSIWMYSTMAALAICLIAVMVDRWPWRQRHTGFVLAHIGILIIMVGSLVTRYFGIDGSMALEPGGASRYVSINEQLVAVYATLNDSSMGESGFRRIVERPVDFLLSPPTAHRPVELSLSGEALKIKEFMPYGLREEKIIASDRSIAGSAVRFQLQNSRVSLTEWLVQPGPGREMSKNLGPAQVILAPQAEKKTKSLQTIVALPEGKNAIILQPIAGSDQLNYEIHTARDPGKIKRGKVKVGESIETGWMGLVLRILKYLPKAEEEITYKALAQSTPMTTPALRFEYGGRSYWLGLNSMVRIFADQAVYIVTYENAKIPLDFDLSLKEFRVGRYQGTVRAASYESLVTVPDRGDVLISMNEPLKHRGFTFYQASFQEDENRRPVASILSVNRDPGRWLKYLGSALIVLGTIHLFYFKRKSARAAQGSTVKNV